MLNAMSLTRSSFYNTKAHCNSSALFIVRKIGFAVLKEIGELYTPMKDCRVDI